MKASKKMNLQCQPKRLQTLALDAVACNVSNLGCKLLKCPQDEKLWEACEKFGELLEEYIPPILANQVTARLIKQIDELLTYVNNGNSAADLHRLLRTVTLPSTSALDLSHVMACFPLMCIRIRTLTRLHSLKLRRCIIPAERESIAIALRSLSCLEEFQCWYGCSDNIIMEIPKTLKKLDVCWSRMVTDTSVEYIVTRGRNLEDIFISGTNISEEGLQELLEKLRAASGICNTTLKTIEHGRITEKHIHLLANGFPCLQQINFGAENDMYDISILSALEHLKVLRFSNGNISGIVKFLRQSGHRLRVLEIIGSHPDVIFKIGKYCKQLQSLTFTSGSSAENPVVESNKEGFVSLEKATLGLEKDQLLEVLKHCVNLRMLCLYNMKEEIMTDILVHCKDSLKHLEELHCPGGMLPESLAHNILNHCPNLQILEGFRIDLKVLRQRHSWYPIRCPIYEKFLESRRHRRP